MSTTVRRLIERAAHFAGSEGAVAKRLRVGPERLSQWKSGSRPMPDHQVIDLAQLTGEDPEKALGAYRWERYTTKKGLWNAAVVIITCAIGAWSPDDTPASSHSSNGERDAAYYVKSTFRRLWRLITSGQHAVDAC
jgi:DNA-binding transcriptional regulator YdaS (Cro superfamily)